MNRLAIDPYFFADAELLPTDAVIMEIGVFEPEKDIRLHAKYPAGRMLIVEGSPTNYATLQRRLPPASGIETAWCALAESEGPVKFYEFQHEQLASTFPRHETEGLQVSARFTVAGKTLAGIMDKFQTKRIDLLLLNCEGAEIFALGSLIAYPHVRAAVTQICTSFHCDHIHVYPPSVRDGILRDMAQWYDIHVNAVIPDIPYYLFIRKLP